MRLLNIHTWQFLECYGKPPPYVITSHRWTPEELTYQDLVGSSLSSRVTEKAGYRKLIDFCRITQNLMKMCPKLLVEYLWIDTCCIDKTNAVELTEALNSMFRWYAQAEVCFAYLSDVVSLDEHPSYVLYSFEKSVWHKRGWCLQELLAPKRILFYNQDWECFGWKPTRWETLWMTARACGIGPLNEILTETTGVPEEVLWDFENTIDTVSVVEKQAWMHGRSTTRIEDKVYCQLGIFGVFMPLIYGEGEHALIRLEEALKQKQRRGRGTEVHEDVEQSRENTRSTDQHGGLPPRRSHPIPSRRPSAVSDLPEHRLCCHVKFDNRHWWTRKREVTVTLKGSETVGSLFALAVEKYDKDSGYEWDVEVGGDWELRHLQVSFNPARGNRVARTTLLRDLPGSETGELWLRAIWIKFRSV